MATRTREAEEDTSSASQARIHWHTCNTFTTHTNINKPKQYFKLQRTPLYKNKNSQRESQEMWPWGFGKERVKKTLSCILSWERVWTILGNHQGRWHGFTLLGVHPTWTTGLPVTLLKSFIPPLPKDPRGCSSLSCSSSESSRGRRDWMGSPLGYRPLCQVQLGLLRSGHSLFHL